MSSSKKWLSKPAVDENGQPILQKNGKPVLRKSYSVLQDDFFNFMRKAGYGDVERGERGSSEEHLTVTQFKVAQEEKQLAALDRKIEKREEKLGKLDEKMESMKADAMTFSEIDSIGRKTLTGKIEMTQAESDRLKALAKKGVASVGIIADLKQRLTNARQDARVWRERYENLREQTKDFLTALKRALERVRVFIDGILRAERPEPQRPRPRLNRERPVSR